MNFDAGIQEFLEKVIEAKLREYHTTKIGVVKSWDPVARRADIQPLVGSYEIDMFNLEVTWTDAAMLRNVPVAFMGTDRSTENIELMPGDTGLILPMMHSLDEIVGTDRREALQPKDPRQQAEQDSFFLPVSWSSVSSASGSSGRHISGTDIRLGDAGAAEKLCTLSEFETHVAEHNKLVAAFLTHVHPVSGANTTQPTALVPPIVSDTTPYTGTSHVKAS